MTSRQLRRAAWRLAVAPLLALLLASCGGGGEPIEPFRPVRVINIGDEMSVLTALPPQGRKYSVNALAGDGQSIDCETYPIWTQAVSNLYNFAYAECNPQHLPQTQAYSYAKPGAMAADFTTQMAEAEKVQPFTSKDLVTVLLGANDVLDLYRRLYVPNPTSDTYNAINTELQARGTRLGQQIAAYFPNGPRFIFSTIPRMGQTPYGLGENIASGDAQRAAVLNDFSNTFNTAVRVTIPNDGRYWGLVELDALINAGMSNPGAYGLANVTNAACAVALPDCTTATLVPGAGPANWLWASDLWMGITAHLNLGNFARSRALANPF